MSDHKSTDHTHSIFSVPFVLTVISACGVVYGDIGTSVLSRSERYSSDLIHMARYRSPRTISWALSPSSGHSSY